MPNWRCVVLNVFLMIPGFTGGNYVLRNAVGRVLVLSGKLSEYSLSE